MNLRLILIRYVFLSCFFFIFPTTFNKICIFDCLLTKRVLIATPANAEWIVSQNVEKTFQENAVNNN